MMGAEVQCIVIPLVALPPQVGDLHGKAKKSRSPFRVNEDDALEQGDRRRHYNGRAMEKRKRERGCVM
jgi:hypothetical protein